MTAPRKNFRERMALARADAGVRSSVWERDTAATRLRRRAESVVLQRAFNRNYLGHYFKSEPAPFHEELYEALENYSRVAVRSPRGHAKTTVMTFSVTVHQVACAPVLRAWERGTLEAEDPELYAAILDVMREEIERRWEAAQAEMAASASNADRAEIAERLLRLTAQRETGRLPLYWDPYIQIISATEEQAEEFTGSILDELVENERLLADWGVLMKDKRPAAGDWVSATNVRVKAFGMLGAIRGGKHGAERPRLAFFDDPDSELTIGNVELRDRQTRKITAATDFGLEPGKSRIFMAGTPLHADAQICRFTDSKRFVKWKKLRFACIKPDGTPLWPARFSLEELESRRQDDPEAFDMEMMDTPPAEDQTFGLATYYEPDELPEGCPTVYALDPSLGETEKSDYQAGISISLHPDGWVAVRRIELMRIGDPLALMREVNSQAVASGADMFVMETIGFQRLLLVFSELDQMDTMSFLMWTPVPRQAENKKLRLRAMAPAWNAGRIRLPKNGACYRLENQARNFPNGKVDGLDVLEMALRKLRQGTGSVAEVRHHRRRSGFGRGQGGF